MKNLRIFLIFLSTLILEAKAFTTSGSLSGAGWGTGSSRSKGSSNPSNIVMKPGVHYAVESFENSIGFKSATPDVSSSLDWKNIHVMQAKVSGEVPVGNMALVYDAAYGVMRKGKGKFIDRDYAGSGKTLIWSESEGKITGKAMDFSAGAAVAKIGSFRGLIGAIYVQRQYQMRDARQTVSNNANFTVFQTNHPTSNASAPPAVGTVVSGLNGTYKLLIYGPWVGGDMQLNLDDSFSLSGQLKAIYALYKANGRWPNYRFEDTTKGYGGQGKIGLSYKVLDSVELSVDATAMYTKLRRGNVKTSDGNIFVDYFRGGTFKSYGLSLGGKINF